MKTTKKIAIISPDSICEKEYYNLSLPSKRVIQLAQALSEFEQVTVLLPKSSTEGSLWFNSKIDIDTYNFSAAFYNWSEELDKKLLEYDYVIIQAVTGVGFHNCSVLPKKINVIVDAWIPMLTQYPIDLLKKHRIQRKFTWEVFLPQYKNLLGRANCILCATDQQKYFLEGQFFMIEKLGWDAFKFSPIHKIPYALHGDFEVAKYSSSQKKLLWYGDIHQYDTLEALVNKLKNTNVHLDIFYRKNITDNHKNSYSVNNLLNSTNLPSNIKDISDTKINYNEYLAGISLNNNWIEDSYTNNCDILELLFRGVPVFTNDYINSKQEYPYLLGNGLYYIADVDSLVEMFIEEDSMKPHSFSNKAINSLREAHNLNTITAPLINYIRTF